jgi:hypothetical protein
MMMLLARPSKDFWTGVNVGSIVLFFAWLIFGKFAMLLIAIYLVAWGVQWYRSGKTAPPIEFVNEQSDDDFELEPLTGIMPYGDEAI